jgi:hypothetical protein
MSSRYYQSSHWKTLRAQCIARDEGRCVVKGCTETGVVADHIRTRPPAPNACYADRLDNLRTLCLTHDAQVKEFKGVRKQGGEFRVKGCDAQGWPLDPERR